MSQQATGRSSIWRHRDLRVALAARALSQLGDAVALFALTIRVHDSGAGAGGVALLLAAAALPMVVLLGVAGHVADTVDSRKVLVASASLQVLACLALAAVEGLWATVALVVVLQTGQAFANPVWGALLPRIVGDAELGRAVAAQRGLLSVAGIAGAALAGVLVGSRGASVALLVDAASFVVLVGAGALIRTRRLAGTDAPGPGLVTSTIVTGPTPGSVPGSVPGSLPGSGEGDTPAGQDRRADRDDRVGRGSRVRQGRVGVWASSAAGLRLLGADPLLRVLFGYLVAFVVVVESVNVAEVFLVRDAVGASATAFGVVQAVSAAGALVGAWVAGRTETDRGRVRNTVVGLVLAAVVIGAVGFAPSVGWVGAGYVVIGAANYLATTSLWPMFTLRTPDAHRGKVLAAVGGVLTVASLCALGLGGVVATLLGPRVTFVTGGALAAVVAVAVAVHLRRVMPAGVVPPPPGAPVSTSSTGSTSSSGGAGRT